MRTRAALLLLASVVALALALYPLSVGAPSGLFGDQAARVGVGEAPPAEPPATRLPSTPAPAPSATPEPPPTPTPAPTALPARLRASATAGVLTATLSLRGYVPAGAASATLWYDTAAGHARRSIALDGAATVRASLVISPGLEAAASDPLAPACPPEPACPPPQLDYSWTVRDLDGRSLVVTGTLALAPAAVPPALPGAWVERATPHFRLFALPGSDAERDLDALALVAEQGYARAAAFVPTTEPVSVSVYLVPRVFWQGGVAHGPGGPLVISHLDRNYTAVEPWSYFVHEITHALGAELLPAGGEAGGVLGEGLAVYATGGHYAVEPVDAWAAAIADSPGYIRLCALRYNFYAAQHETAYLEAASFTGYLIDTYGMPAFLEMYRLQQPQRGGHAVDQDAFCAEDDARIAAPLEQTNAELERDWLAWLGERPPSEAERQAVALQIRFFDTLRLYQEQMDPPARMLPPPPESWGGEMRVAMGYAASGRRAAVFETMIESAGRAITAGELGRAERLLDAVDAGLAAGAVPEDALAGDHAAIVDLLAGAARAARLDGDDRDAVRLTPDGVARQADLRYDLARLDVRGEIAEGMVEVRRALTQPDSVESELVWARFERGAGGWQLTAWEPAMPAVAPPPESIAIEAQ